MFSFYKNTLQEVFNQSIDDYCQNSAFAPDVHTSVNFSQANLKTAKMNPLGTGRPWSKVEADLVTTFQDFTSEYIRQINLHFKSFNKYLTHQGVDVTIQMQNNPQRKRQYQEFVASEELNFWSDFPRKKKFYHAYLRKLYTLFNQCKMPDSLLTAPEEDDRSKKGASSQQKEYIRDIQLIISLCLDLMPQASSDFTERIETPQPLPTAVQNVWELTDFSSTVISNDTSKDSSKEITDEGSPEHLNVKDLRKPTSNSSHNETILSGNCIMSYIGGLEQGINMAMDKEARHLRKYLYLNRRRFDQVVEEVQMLDTEQIKNWVILGNLMTIMVSDVIQLFLSTQENIRISLGLVEVLMIYSNYFSKSFAAYDEALPASTPTLFDFYQNQIQFQWAQIFGQLSKLSPVTFGNCLKFFNTALINDHKMLKKEEIEDLSEQIYHSRFLHIQPFLLDESQAGASYKIWAQQQLKASASKTGKIVEMFEECLKYLNSSKVTTEFRAILIKALRQLIAQLDFRDASIVAASPDLKRLWMQAVVKVYHYADNVIIKSIFPDISSINLKRVVSEEHWDKLLEDDFHQQVLFLFIQIIKVSDTAFFNTALVRLMNWISLPQMLESKRAFQLATRLLLELYTPEMYKFSEFMHWQPKILNHVFMLKDTQRDFHTPIVSHTDVSVFTQMAHRCPGLLNHSDQKVIDSFLQQNQGKSTYQLGISLRETFDQIFRPTKMDLARGKKRKTPYFVQFFHHQYLDLMAIYDLEFLTKTALPSFLEKAAKEDQCSAELILLALHHAHKLLDPAQNFKQKYVTVHQQIADSLGDQNYMVLKAKALEKTTELFQNYIESALALLVQSPLFKGGIAQDSIDFFRSAQYRELCTDRMGVLYPSPSLSLMKESEYVSKFMKRNGFAHYVVELNESLMTFEDHSEIMGHHYEKKDIFDPYAVLDLGKNVTSSDDEEEFPELYEEDVHGRYDDFFAIPNEQYNSDQRKKKSLRDPEHTNKDLSQILNWLDKETGFTWDKKKERHIRHRLSSYLIESAPTAPVAPMGKQKSSASKKNDSPVKIPESQPSLSEAQKITFYTEHANPVWKLQLKIRIQITKMLHYLPKVWTNKFISQPSCKEILLNEKGEIKEFSEQAPPIEVSLQLDPEDFHLNFNHVREENEKNVDNLILILQNMKTEQAGSQGTKRLQGTEYDRLQNVSDFILPMGLLSVDYEVASKTSKLIQKLVVFSNLETKVAVLDQIIYIIKELLVCSTEEHHLAMFLQLLATTLKLWHHSEIHKVRLVKGSKQDRLQGLQTYIIDSEKRVKKRKGEGEESVIAEKMTYGGDIQAYLYLFDLIDGIGVTSLCNKARLNRNLGIKIIHESGKLRRLIGGMDSRKSIADLLYSNELAIRERLVDKLTLLILFKSRTSGSDDDNGESKPGDLQFAKVYNREEIDLIVQNLSFFKVIEDSFDYSKEKINESLARDLQVAFLGEVVTLWKNEFKVLAQPWTSKYKDTVFNKLNRQHRIIGQKLLNFMFNLSRRSVLIFENKSDLIQKKNTLAEKVLPKEVLRGRPSGPRVSLDTRAKVEDSSGIMTQHRDFANLNLLSAIVLYNIMISSFNQIEPSFLEFEEGQGEKKVKATGGSEIEDIISLQQQKQEEESKDPKELIKVTKKLKIRNYLDDLFNVIQLVNLDPSEFQKVPATVISPSRLPVSSVILSFTFLIQSPLPLALSSKRNQLCIEQAFSKGKVNLKSRPKAKAAEEVLKVVATKADIVEVLQFQFEHLSAIFNNQVKDNVDGQYLLNSVLFYSLLFVSCDAGDGDGFASELHYLVRRSLSATLPAHAFFPDSRRILTRELTSILEILQSVVQDILSRPYQHEAKEMLTSILQNGQAKLCRLARKALQNDTIPEANRSEWEACIEQLLPFEQMKKIVEFNQNCSIPLYFDWLRHKNKQSYEITLKFQNYLRQEQNARASLTKLRRSQKQSEPLVQSENLQLEFGYLLELQTQGYDVLQYFNFQRNSSKARENMDTKQQIQSGVADMKLLLSNVYQFYAAQEDVSMLLSNVNPFYECFLNQFVRPDFEEEDQAQLVQFMKENRFMQVYQRLIAPCFNLQFSSGQQRSKWQLIDTQLEKFIQYKIHGKYFLLSLVMAINLRATGNNKQNQMIERSRLVCLATLPLMFDDREEFREQVEQMISKMDIEALINPGNKEFFRFIKKTIYEEEVFSFQNQFEEYFSINGFIRNLLNEVIKFQSNNENHLNSSSLMLIRILDTLTYFMSKKGGLPLQLRRAPRAAEDKSRFLFDHMIDFKSFEFLSKLFKISEKLIEFDQDMTILNMWYKLVENQIDNFEIVAKFLVHNISSFQIKLGQQAAAEKSLESSRKGRSHAQKQADQAQYSIDFEKQQMFSIQILTYIKARTQRADVRNSIQVSSESPSWAKFLIQMLPYAQLNTQTKYVLEKVKLKKLLQAMHREVNQTKTPLQLKIAHKDSKIQILRFDNMVSQSFGEEAFKDKIGTKESVSMTQLLESRTFLRTFSTNKVKEQSIMANLLFTFRRLVKEKFNKVTPAPQLPQFNELVVKYLENVIVFVANDTSRAIQLIKVSKEQLLYLVVSILVLVAHLVHHYSDQRFRYLTDLFKDLVANLTELEPFFFLNTLTPHQLKHSLPPKKGQNPSSSVADRVLTMFNFKTTLFDCFDGFTRIFFTMTINLQGDTDLWHTMIDLYQATYRGMREVQSQKIRNQQDLGDSSLSLSIVSTTRKMRHVILQMLQSAFFNLHDLASMDPRLAKSIEKKRTQKSLPSETPAENKNKIYAHLRNFYQQMERIIDYVLFSQDLDRYKRELSKRQTMDASAGNTADIFSSDISTSSRSVIFSLNTLYWAGIACLEAPLHFQENKEGDPIHKNCSRWTKQIQRLGILAVRRVLEETSFHKILIVYQTLSDLFYSYNLQMSCGKSSLMSILLSSIRNPYCTKDALKMLIITIKMWDPRLLCGFDDQGQQAEVELLRLLYLLPFFMQQFVEPLIGESKTVEAAFQNKRNMIHILKKSLPSVEITKKSEIINCLDTISQLSSQADELRKPALIQEKAADIKAEFQNLIRFTMELMKREGYTENLAHCYLTFTTLQEEAPVLQPAPDLPFKVEDLANLVDLVKTEVFEDEEEELDELIEGIKTQEYRSSVVTGRQKVLGEEHQGKYRKEFVGLYFGIKNIILREIDFMDKDIDVGAFFDREQQYLVDSSLQQTTAEKADPRTSRLNSEAMRNIENDDEDDGLSTPHDMDPTTVSPNEDLKEEGHEYSHTEALVSPQMEDTSFSQPPTSTGVIPRSDQFSRGHTAVEEKKYTHSPIRSVDHHPASDGSENIPSQGMPSDNLRQQSEPVQFNFRNRMEEKDRSKSKSRSRYAAQAESSGTDDDDEANHVNLGNMRPDKVEEGHVSETKSFADRTLEQRIIQQSHQASEAEASQHQEVLANQTRAEAAKREFAGGDVITFKKPNLVTQQQQPEDDDGEIQLPSARYGTTVHNEDLNERETPSGVLHKDSSPQESLPSSAQRQFYGSINPRDNQSQMSSAMPEPEQMQGRADFLQLQKKLADQKQRMAAEEYQKRMMTSQQNQPIEVSSMARPHTSALHGGQSNLLPEEGHKGMNYHHDQDQKKKNTMVYFNQPSQIDPRVPSTSQYQQARPDSYMSHAEQRRPYHEDRYEGAQTQRIPEKPAHYQPPHSMQQYPHEVPQSIAGHSEAMSLQTYDGQMYGQGPTHLLPQKPQQNYAQSHYQMPENPPQYQFSHQTSHQALHRPKDPPYQQQQMRTQQIPAGYGQQYQQQQQRYPQQQFPHEQFPQEQFPQEQLPQEQFTQEQFVKQHQPMQTAPHLQQHPAQSYYPQQPTNSQMITPKKEEPRGPIAIQPNFVASKSSRIWSDVASQKTQSYMQGDVPLEVSQSEIALSQIPSLAPKAEQQQQQQPNQKQPHESIHFL